MSRGLVGEELEREGAELAHTVIARQSTGSTNDDARLLAEEGARHGTVVMADHQASGRGRLGRSWSSPPGKNLLFSVILREGAWKDSPGLVTIAAGAGIADALRRTCAMDARVKWPNDVRVSGKKLCGILAEAGGARGLDYAVLGVGLNVNVALDEMPEELRDISTSLAIEAGQPWDRPAVFKNVIKGVEDALSVLSRGGPRALTEKWKGVSETLGRKVRVETPSGVIFGTAADLREDGALMVLDRKGCERTVLAGDVVTLRPEE